MKTHTETAFETVLERLLDGGYEALSPDGFDREGAIFPEVVLDFIRSTWKRSATSRASIGTSPRRDMRSGRWSRSLARLMALLGEI